MADSKINPVLEQVASSNKKEHGLRDEKKQVAKLESRINSLLQQKDSLDPSVIMSLRGEAAMLDRTADYADQLANLAEKNDPDFKKKNLEEVKELLSTQLGIPAEFVDQLSILVKAGPDALREAANVYRNEATKKREHADLLGSQLEKVDKEIKELNHIKEHLSDQNGSASSSIKNFLADLRYKEAIRDKSEQVLKEMLQQIEAGV